MVAWRELLFVFKWTKAYVFTGESIDATGNPIFNYRRIDLPDQTFGLPGLYAPLACAESDGVYLITPYGGLYRTTGDTPLPVSGPVRPIFTRTPVLSTSLENASIPSLSAAGNWIFIVYTTQAGPVRTLVFDRVSGDWTMWSIAPGSGQYCSVNGVPAYVSGNDVYSMSPYATTDNGSAITWRYSSGWYDLGAPGQRKVVRWSRVTGTGNVTLERFADYGTTDANSGTLACGSTTSTVRHSKSWQGTLMQHKLSGSGSASVSSLDHGMRGVRPAGAR